MPQSQWTANGTSDAAGNLTIRFPTINVNTEWTGIVSVPQAPNTAELSVVVNDTVVTSLGGSSSFGPIQLGSTDVLRITGTGLAASTQYQGVLIGNLVYGSSAPVTPVPTASAVQAALTGAIESSFPGGSLVGSTSWSGSAGPWTLASIPMAPTTRTLLIRVSNDALVSNLTVTGDQTGVTYYNQIPYLSNSRSVTTKCFAVVPIAALADTTVTVVAHAGGPGGNGSMQVYADTAVYQESEFYNGNTNAAGTGAPGAIVVGPCRLLTAWCQGCTILLDGSATILGGTDNQMTFPENTILAAGHGLSQSGAGFAGVTYAWP